MRVRPVLQVTFLETRAGKTKVRGLMSQPPREKGEVGLFLPPDVLIVARLMRYGKRCRLATLSARQGKSTHLVEMGERYEFLDEWDLGRAKIVLSTDSDWKATRFKPEDAIVITVHGHRCEIPIKKGIGSTELRCSSLDVNLCQVSSGKWIDMDNLPEGAEVVKDAWNHEHCAICQQCICEICGPEAWLSEDGVWVCKKCYAEYVLRKNIDFHCWDEEAKKEESA